MFSSLKLSSLLTLPVLFSSVLSLSPPLINKRQSSSTSATGFAQPSSWLTVIPDSNLGEPLNIVISNASSSGVLSDPFPYFSSLFFSPNNCLGITLGDAQAANLNDGQGVVNQTSLLRYNFDNGISTCEESINGGQHVRYWMQKSTGAIFLAASVEDSAGNDHTIADNGYDLGRDWLVGNATDSSGTTSPQDQSSYTATMVSMSVDIDASDINHGISIDDKVYVLTVTQTKKGNGADVTSTASSSSSTSSTSAGFPNFKGAAWMPLIALATMLLVLSSIPGVSAQGVAPAASPRARLHTHADIRAALDSRLLNLGEKSNTIPPIPLSDELRAQINDVSPFAAASYCKGPQEGHWGGGECGAPCEAVKEPVEILWRAGDGDLNPHRQLLYLPNRQALLLAAEGSTFVKLKSILNDFDFFPLKAGHPIVATLEKYGRTDQEAGGTVRVHGGIEQTWSRLYPQVLTSVRSALSSHPQIQKIIFTGHSLGAAVVLLDMLALREDLKDKQFGLPFEAMVFATPRFWNEHGARLLDGVLGNESAGISYYHVHHGNDLFLHLPPRSLDFLHPSHEIFLPDNGTTALLCPGRENEHCSLSRPLTSLGLQDHYGPYLGRMMGRDDDLKCLQ